MVNFKEDEQLKMLNHSCAHLMAQAIKHLYPQAKFWVGPVVAEGFYYDVDLGDDVIRDEDIAAIEKEMNFSLYHGECVVLGMIAALNICVELGTITAEERDDALNTFALYEFPDHVTGIKIDDVIAVSKNDKKMDAGKVKFILLKSVGDAYIDRDITDDQMRRALEGVIR